MPWGVFLSESYTHQKKAYPVFYLQILLLVPNSVFRNTGNRERLAGKACYQNVVIGNICGIYFRDIVIRIFAKIGKICFLTIPVPLV